MLAQRFPLQSFYWNVIYLFYLEAEKPTNSEPPKPANRITALDNPSELIKQAQKELVFNNTANKEESKKAEGAKGIKENDPCNTVKKFGKLTWVYLE